MAVNIQITMSTKAWIVWEIIVWGLMVILILATIVSNWMMPRGTFVDTGDVSCPDVGQCQEQYYEDTSNVNIPSWARLLRNDGFILPAIALGVLGSYTTIQRKNQQEEDQRKQKLTKQD